MRNARCSAHIRFFFALFVAVILTSPSWASFTLEQVLSYSFPSELVAAKHSPRIAWVFNSKGVRNVWVADAPDFAARQVTHYAADDGQPIASLRITPDGRTVVYARGTELNHASEAADPNHNVQQHRRKWLAIVAFAAPLTVVSSRCGRRMSRTVIRGCWARWAVARKGARTSKSLPTGSPRCGPRKAKSGLPPFPGAVRRMN